MSIQHIILLLQEYCCLCYLSFAIAFVLWALTNTILWWPVFVHFSSVRWYWLYVSLCSLLVVLLGWSVPILAPNGLVTTSLLSQSSLVIRSTISRLIFFASEDRNLPHRQRETLTESIEIKEKSKWRLLTSNLLIMHLSSQTDLSYWEYKVKRNWEW